MSNRSHRAAPLLALTLLAGLFLAALPRAQMLEPDATPRAIPAWEHLSAALVALDQAQVQQVEYELWQDVRESVELGRAAAAAAKAAGGESALCLVVDRTLAAVGQRQDLLEREAFAPERAADHEAPNAWLEGEYVAVADALNALADELLLVEGRVIQTSFLLSEILFGQERDAEAQDVLGRGLALWPASASLHEQARAWADVLPAPEHLLNQLDLRVASLGLADSDFAAIGLETLSVLHSAMGKHRYDAREFTVAALHFDRSARALQRSRSMPRKWPDDEIKFREADAFVNAAYAYQGLALDGWAVDRGDETAALAAEACEDALTAALRSVPRHPAAMDAVLWLGDRLMNRGDSDGVTQADTASMRDFYGRMAERFNEADWWNNYAFWCRETGTASEERGEPKEARALYEASYKAYSRTIELAPDNARYVNDTGLMLLYHLHRDLDRAQGLFEQAWVLGEAVCANPFVEPDVHAQNFEAYTDAMLNLSRLHLERRNLESAANVLNKLIELAPSRPDVVLTQKQLEAAQLSHG